MEVLALPINVPAERALEHFQRPRWGNLFGLRQKAIGIAAPDAPQTRTPPFIELIWMPAHAVGLDTVLRGQPTVIWAAVDGWSGHFSLFDGFTELAIRDIHEECFPLQVKVNAAERIARKGVLQYILRQRGQIKKPTVEGVHEIRAFHYPAWVCYVEKRAGRLDLRVLDAYTGRPGGSRMRMAVLNAFVAARQARNTGSD